MMLFSFNRAMSIPVVGICCALCALASAQATTSAPATMPVGNENGAKLVQNVQYGEATGEKLLLDVSVPAGQGPFGVVIMVHGGGWSGGDKQKDVTPALEAMTGKFVWFSINYRMAPKNRWPACLEDVATAVRWIKAHAAEYKGDPKRVVLMGHSAGGHLACAVALQADDATRVQGVVGLAPVTDFVVDTKRRGGLSKSLQWLLNETVADERVLAILREMSPIEHVHAGAPPFLLLQGSVDKTVPREQTESFAAKLSIVWRIGSGNQRCVESIAGNHSSV